MKTFPPLASSCIFITFEFEYISISKLPIQEKIHYHAFPLFSFKPNQWKGERSLLLYINIISNFIPMVIVVPPPQCNRGQDYWKERKPICRIKCDMNNWKYERNMTKITFNLDVIFRSINVFGCSSVLLSPPLPLRRNDRVKAIRCNPGQNVYKNTAKTYWKIL